MLFTITLNIPREAAERIGDERPDLLLHAALDAKIREVVYGALVAGVVEKGTVDRLAGDNSASGGRRSAA